MTLPVKLLASTRAKLVVGALAVFALGLIVWWVAARPGSPHDGEPAESGGIRVGPYLVTEPAGGFRTLRHDDGTELVLDAQPVRIVSLTVGTDELLFELVDPSRIVGLSQLATDARYSNVVEQARELDRSVATHAEAILDRQPDLVLAASYTAPDTLRALRQAQTPTLLLADFEDLDDLKANLRVVGYATGSEDAADQLAHDVDAAMRAGRAKVEHAKEAAGRSEAPLVLAWEGGTVLAGETLFHGVATSLGAENPAADAGLRGWPKVSAEQAAAWLPDVIFASAGPGQHRATVEAIAADALLRETPAVRSQTVFAIDNAVFYSTSQHVVKLIEAIADGVAASIDARGAGE